MLSLRFTATKQTRDTQHSPVPAAGGTALVPHQAPARVQRAVLPAPRTAAAALLPVPCGAARCCTGCPADAPGGAGMRFLT